jgi:hypothetical protein
MIISFLNVLGIPAFFDTGSLLIEKNKVSSLLILFAIYKWRHRLQKISVRAEKDRGLALGALFNCALPRRSSFKGDPNFSLAVGATSCYFFDHSVLLTAHFNPQITQITQIPLKTRSLHMRLLVAY